MSWDQYSETPASNDIANYFQTGMAPSKVKNAGWDIMADLASRFANMHTSGGTATAFTVTQTRQWGALVNGLELTWLPNATNTGAATLAVDGLTAKNLFAYGVAAVAGMVQINVPCTVKYDGTQFNIQNPQNPSGTFTATSTGITGAPTATATYRTSWPLCMMNFGTGIAGTGSSTAFTLTGMPSVLTPAITQAFLTSAEDATAGTAATIIFTASSTTITLGKGSVVGQGASGWTASGIKAFANGAVPGTNPTFIFSVV